jgi:2-polyprenyl-3-methyl-5-hydroxy-6-metoxy-1,4-benzoquinol methylase
MALPYQCSPVRNANITWEQIPCPLCGTFDEETFLEAAADPDNTLYRLVRCRSCDMVYMNPRPDESSIGQFYPDDYEAYRQPVRDESSWRHRTGRYLEQLVLARNYGYPPTLRGVREKALAWLASPWFGPDRYSQTALPFVGEGRLLDYGCGAGSYAARMRERGWNVRGMDFSARAAQEAKRLHGLDVLVGTLPHPAIEPRSFDLITMGAVLEHVHWPHQLIGAGVEALQPGGMLAVSVPNIASWGYRVFGQDWWPLELPRHLLHFTPVTLARLMEAHGLEVVELRKQVRGSWMRRSMDRGDRPGRPLFRRCVSKLGKLNPVRRLLTAWSAWLGKPDSLLILARRPVSGWLPRSVEAA